MALLVDRLNPIGWVAGNLITADQINGIDQNPVTVADYVEAQRVDVTLYGALGDNATDDSAAIQAAALVADASGAELWFPPGVYLCNSVTWGDHSITGVPIQSHLRCNSTSNPIFNSTINHGVSATVSNSKRMSGLSLSFVSTSSTGELVGVHGTARVGFYDCDFDSQGSSGSGTGGVGLGDTSDSTRAVFHNCSFTLSGAADLAVGFVTGSTTYVSMTNCRVRLLSSARTASFALVNGTYIKASNCRFDLSGATASVSPIKIFGGSSNLEIAVSTTTVTEAASGSVQIYAQGAAGVVADSANIYPSTAALFSISPLDWNVCSRNRHLSTTQSGGGTLALNPLDYSSFCVHISDNTSFAISATSAPVGSTFDLLLWRNASPSGTITWSSSFGVFSTLQEGVSFPAVIPVNHVASAKFLRSDGPDGERWYLIGSGVTYT